MASQFWRQARNYNLNRPEMMRKHWDFFNQIIRFEQEPEEDLECEVIYRSPRPQFKRKMESARRKQKVHNYQPPTPIR